MSAQNGLVQRLWNYCNVLRDDGLSYGDYVEQLTYLLFLKMADEQTKPPFSRPAIVPEGLDWPSLLERDGDELEVHYRHVLTELGRKPGMLGVIFRKAQNRIQDPAKLRRLDRRPDRPGELADARRRREGRRLRGAAGEERRGREVRRGPVLHAAAADPGDRRGDAAASRGCGSATRRAARAASCSRRTSRSRGTTCSTPTRSGTSATRRCAGWEIVDNTARLCVMNLLLHGIGDEEHESPIAVDDALKADPGERFEMVLTNPPFGRKSSMTFVSEEGEVEREDLVVVRDDFWASTSNKQLNFVQHVKTLLDDRRAGGGGRARQRALRGRRRRDGAAEAARTSATSTRCCGCRPGSSTRRA